MARRVMQRSLKVVHDVRSAKVLAIGSAALHGEVGQRRLLANREGSDGTIQCGRERGHARVPAHLPPDQIARWPDVQFRHMPGEKQQAPVAPRDFRRCGCILRPALCAHQPPRLGEHKWRKHVVVARVVVRQLDEAFRASAARPRWLALVIGEDESLGRALASTQAKMRDGRWRWWYRERRR